MVGFDEVVSVFDILMVEDEKELAKLLKIYIERANYTIQLVTSGEEALDFLKNNTVKMLLLDITLPNLDGFVVCREVRRMGSIPILIISARVSKEDQLNGFRLGADDYLEKPVDPDLLVAKINSLFTRVYGVHTEKEILYSGNLMIDKSARKVYKEKTLVELNAKEYELLLIMVENSGKTLDKDFLFYKIWGVDSFSENQTLTVHINMLCNKIEENPKKPLRIKTVWGIGYRYEEL
ncbi:MAG: response regulator transcription factor [Lachnospiraceae bacterium]|nr:response regulator transcription factor [Lachnospiraceae bacterium]